MLRAASMNGDTDDIGIAALAILTVATLSSMEGNIIITTRAKKMAGPTNNIITAITEPRASFWLHVYECRRILLAGDSGKNYVSMAAIRRLSHATAQSGRRIRSERLLSANCY